MSPRTLAVVALALVFGMSSAFAVYQLAVRPPELAPQELVEVFVMNENIAPGAILDDSHVARREFPKDRLPPYSITKADDYRNRLVKLEMLKDEPVDTRCLGKPGEISLTTMFEKGERAYTCAVADSAALGSGFILPQSFVDVMVSLKAKASRDEEAPSITNVLLQRVQVLAIGSAIAPPKGSNMADDTKGRLRTVTMRVMPEQAALLQQGSSMGVLHLVLRHKDDHEIISIPGVSDADVRKLGGPQTPIIDDITLQEKFDLQLAAVTKDLQDQIKKLEERKVVGHDDKSEGRPIAILKGTSRSYAEVVHAVDDPETSQTRSAGSLLAE